MAAEGNIIVRFLYTGTEGEIIPDEATHITVAESCTFVRARSFWGNRNIVEVICHDRVEKIEFFAFSGCRSLRRVIMPGVKIVGRCAFSDCGALTEMECDKVEIIGDQAFQVCQSLRAINLPSSRIVEGFSFQHCYVLTDVKFGSNLERIDELAFNECCSLDRIAIPLKDGLIIADDTFQACENLKFVDLVEGEVHAIIASFNMEEWRNDVNKEIGSINQILPNARAGYWDEWNDDDGEKAIEIRRWIRSVLGKIDHYKAEHQRVLNETTTLLELAIWKSNLDDTDESQIVREGVRTTRGSVKRARREICITSGASIVIKNVLPFLQLKS